jgi:hypothetical protein
LETKRGTFVSDKNCFFIKTLGIQWVWSFVPIGTEFAQFITIRFLRQIFKKKQKSSPSEAGK